MKYFDVKSLNAYSHISPRIFLNKKSTKAKKYDKIDKKKLELSN